MNRPGGLVKVHEGGCCLFAGNTMLLHMNPSGNGLQILAFKLSCRRFFNKRCGTAILIKDCFKIKQVIWDDAGWFVQVLVDFDDN